MNAYQKLYVLLFAEIVAGRSDGAVAKGLRKQMDLLPPYSNKKDDAADRQKTSWGLAIGGELYYRHAYPELTLC